MKKIVIVSSAVVVLAACFGAWYLIQGGDRAGSEESSEAHGTVWDRFAVVGELSKQDFEVWPGKLECDAWHRWDGFSRDKELLVSDGMIAYDDGDVGEFVASTQDGTVIPAQLSARFEWWRGEVRGSSVVMEGWYTAGNDDLKELSMTGTLADGELFLEGERGPRTCRITAKRPE